MQLLNVSAHSGLCPFGIVSFQDCVSFGIVIMGMVSICDRVHFDLCNSGLCPFGIVFIRSGVDSGKRSFGMVFIWDCVHSGSCTGTLPKYVTR